MAIIVLVVVQKISLLQLQSITTLSNFLSTKKTNRNRYVFELHQEVIEKEEPRKLISCDGSGSDKQLVQFTKRATSLTTPVRCHS